MIVVGRPLPREELDPRAPAIREQRIFVRTLVGLAVPYLGIGYGAQLLASAMLGQLVEPPAKKLGAGEMKLTAAARTDKLLSGEPDSLPVVRWPAPSFSLPERAVLLAGTSESPDAFRLGECAWGVLPHVEVTPEGFGDWVTETAIDGANPEVLVTELNRVREPRQQLAYRIMDRYLDRVTSFCHDEPPLVQLEDHSPRPE